MSLKVLIVPDKFKGTLTATAAAKAIARGWRKARRLDEIELLPMSDGGDGFGEVLSGYLHAKEIAIKTVDASHRPCRALWWWEPKSKTAIIESANVIGLALLPSKKFHPYKLDTYGLGAVIRAAAAKGAKRCFIGIGGSATNDGGFGVARALGWRFLHSTSPEKSITEWTQLHRATALIPSGIKKWFEDLVVAVDVQNPLLGPRGCTRIYGPQKGLQPGDFSFAERCLHGLAKLAAHANPQPLLSRNGGKMASEPGAGAAGGLGFGLRSFAGARLQPGFELFAQYSRLKDRMRSADLIITGEGSIDLSTAMGKGVGEIAELCHKMKIPCLGLAGTVTLNPARKKSLFTRQHGLTELTDTQEAKRNASIWLERLAEKVARSWE